MAGTWLVCRHQHQAVQTPCEVGVVQAGLFYERIGNTFGLTELGSGVANAKPSGMAIQHMHPTLGERLFCCASLDGINYDIWQYDGVDTWVLILNLGATGNPFTFGGFAPMTGSDGQPYIVLDYQASGGISFVRYDWSSGAWSTDNLGFGVAVGTTSFAHKGLLHRRIHRNSGGVAEAYSYDPVSQAIVGRIVGTGQLNAPPMFFTLGERLFRYEPSSNVAGARVFEWTLGTWALLSVTPDIWGGTGFECYGAVFRISDTKVLMITPGNSAGQNLASDGLYAALIQIVGGVLTFTDVTNPVIPAFLRGGTTTGVPANFSCYAITDSDVNPGSPEFYFYFMSDNSTADASMTLCRATDETTEFQIVDAAQINNNWAPPGRSFNGGGAFAFTPGELSALATDATKASTGLLIDFQLGGDPLVVNHGAVGGVGGPFEVGETMTSSSGGSATILVVDSTGLQVKLGGVTGTFLDTDTLTQTTGPNAGSTATQSGASTGLSATRVASLRYVNNLGIPVAIGALVPGSAVGGGTVVGSEIQGCTADPTIAQSVIWDFLSDGVPNGSWRNIQVQLDRS